MLNTRQQNLLRRFAMWGTMNMAGGAWGDLRVLERLGYVRPVNRHVYEYTGK